MADFAAIKSKVESYVLDLPSSTQTLIGDWVNKAVRDAEVEHNFLHMLAEQTYITSPGVRVLGAKPALWKARRAAPSLLFDDGGDEEIYWAPSGSEMVRVYDTGDPDDDGEPVFLLETASDLEVYPFPDGISDYADGNYRVVVPYWSFSAVLTDDADTNFFTTAGEWYTVFAAVAEGLMFNRDEERAVQYLERANQQLSKLIRADKSMRRARRDHLTIRPAVYGRVPLRNRRRRAL